MTNLAGEPAVPDELAALERHLRRALHRFDCPTPHAIGEYELDLLSPEHRTQVAQHVLDCPKCAGELATLRSFLRERSAPAPHPGPIDRARRIVATLVAPSGLGYDPQRGADDTSPRGAGVQTYEAGDLTLTLSFDFDAQQGIAALTGLVAANDPMTTLAATVLLVPRTADSSLPRRDVMAASLDAWGNFAFDEVAPGRYRLELERNHATVVVDDLVLGP